MSQEFSPIATGVAGTTTNNSAAAGAVGEYVESLISSQTAIPTTTGVYGDLTSISLTAGDWDVTGFVVYVPNGATMVYFDTFISTTPGNSGAGTTMGINAAENPPAPAGIGTAVTIPSYRMSLAITTIVYLKTACGFSVATPKYSCRLSARRMR